MGVVLLTGDLMIASRVEGAATRVGAKLETAATEEQAAAVCARQPIQLLLVDLSTPGLRAESLVGRMTALAADRPKIVAFGPHVHESLLAAAREAGCDEVVSRGQFLAQVDTILRRFVDP